MVFSVSVSSTVVLASALPAFVSGVVFTKDNGSPKANNNNKNAVLTNNDCPAAISLNERFVWSTEQGDSPVWYGWAVGGAVTNTTEPGASAPTTSLVAGDASPGVICIPKKVADNTPGVQQLTYRENVCNNDEYRVEAAMSQSVGRAIPAGSKQSDWTCGGVDGRYAVEQCRNGAPYEYTDSADASSDLTCPVVYEVLFYYYTDADQAYYLTAVADGFQPALIPDNMDVESFYKSGDVELMQLFMPYSVYTPRSKANQYFANQKDYILLQSGCTAMDSVVSGASWGLLDSDSTDLASGLERCTCVAFQQGENVTQQNCEQTFSQAGQGLSIGAFMDNNYIIAL